MPRCPSPLRDGVYVYRPGHGWRRGGSWRRGSSVLVFVNSVCSSGCGWALERLWPSLGDAIESGVVDLVLVVCTRFRYICGSQEARKLFTEYNVIASPSIVVECCGARWSMMGKLRVEEELPRLAPRLRGPRGA